MGRPRSPNFELTLCETYLTLMLTRSINAPRSLTGAFLGPIYTQYEYKGTE